MVQPTIWYIHGAFASSRSFAWLKTNLPPHHEVAVDYSCRGNLSGVVDSMQERVSQAGDVSIVGHSLGGVIGVALARRCPNIETVITLASPFGGSRLATFLQYVMPGSFMGSIHPNSGLMMEARQGDFPVRVRSIVATGGSSPLMVEPNDGVVTVSSQRALVGAEYHELPVNHFEVLMAEETRNLIRDAIW